ncbi:DUF2971 domain-containing protein [Laribacter hongkongensis]|uniref:DUF2971 domain-containing protein n=1 Tax=Laribacter hongkongensis TaxID=168471 RepID=UPI0009DC3038|nr:DUF2971 domain-containing protein [Laribacter hongkongensis]
MTPPSTPKKLYKYISSNGAIQLFKTPSVWFRLPNKLNDIFDMCPAGSHPIDGFASVAILCLCETPVSAPMWSHYGEEGKGVVLEFDTQTDFFKRNVPHKVRYQAKRPTVKNLYDAMLVKHTDWAYEREWRCFADAACFSSFPMRFLKSQQALVVPFPFDSLTAIIHGFDGRVAKEAKNFLENPLARHVNHFVCRIDSLDFKFNLRTLNDTSHIFENRNAVMWGRGC